MKISELISRLETVRQEHGNLTVVWGEYTAQDKFRPDQGSVIKYPDEAVFDLARCDESVRRRLQGDVWADPTPK